MAYILDKVTSEVLDSTAVSWYASADSLGIPQIDSEKVITWAEQHIDYANATNKSSAYAIFDENNTQEAVAFVDIIYSEVAPRHGWLKVLSISLSPVYSASEVEADYDKILTVIDIYVTAVTGTIDLSGDHSAKVIKIFGRNDGLYKLLAILRERLASVNSTKFSAKMEGRWLVISVL